jgi:ABC-type spermidine/putrescine transport system permease subunit II
MTNPAIVGGPSQGARPLFWVVTVLGLAIIYAPALYLLLASLNPGRQLGLVSPDAASLVWYRALIDDRRLLAALRESAYIGGATALIAAPLGLSAALSYREMRRSRDAFLLAVLLAMFIPGSIQGLGLSALLKAISIKPSWLTVVAGHIVWTLPFTFTISLVGLASIKQVAISAARDLGAGPIRAFLDVTLPLMRGSLVSSFLFAFLLSLNEFARAYYLVGRQNTLPLHMFGAMSSGASPTIYAFSGAVLLISMTVVGGLMVWRGLAKP